MVPPPMSSTEIKTTGNIIDCSLSLTGTRIVILVATGFEVYDWDLQPKVAAEPKKIASWSSTSCTEILPTARFRQVLIQGENRISLLSCSTSGGSKITNYAVDRSSETLINAVIELDTLYGDGKDPFTNIFTDASGDFLWWQTSTGLNCLDQAELSSASAVHPSTEIVVFEAHEENADDISLEQKHQPRRHARIFSLSRKGELFAKDKLLVRGCTSFVSTNTHLLLTTSLHLLKFVHIDTSDGRYRKCRICQWLIDCRI